MLKKEELQRYNRHIILPEFGLECQEKLKKAAVLVIGAGGLGCPILSYLCAAGVGRIGIVDGDTVEESNLQRQVLFSTEDVGKAKVEVAKEKLTKQNPFVVFETYHERLTNLNALSIVANYDIVVDGSDNFPTRYLVNDACVIQNKILVFGAIFKFDGQLSVFNYQGGPTYRCLFPEPPAAGEVPNCSDIGVLGVLPALIGSMMASETIKVITGIGEVLSGKLLAIDTLTMQQQLLRFQKHEPNGQIKKLTDYQSFCGIKETVEPKEKEINPADLAQMMGKEEIQLIDVREPYEYEICHIAESKLIPLQQLPSRIQEIDPKKKIVVICHHGIRSASAIKYLEVEHAYSNLINLSGGIDAWATTVDTAMERY